LYLTFSEPDLPTVKSAKSKASNANRTEESKPVSIFPVQKTKPTISPVKKTKRIIKTKPSEESCHAEISEPEEKEKPSKKAKARGKRKRPSTDDEFDPINALEPKPSKNPASARPARRKSAKRSKNEVSEEELSNLTPKTEDGPTPLNLFALGFEETTEKPVIKMKVFMTQEQRLTSNVASGRANENYKKIDLKKKSYSKGKRTGEFLKKMDYKRKLAHKVRLFISPLFLNNEIFYLFCVFF